MPKGRIISALSSCRMACERVLLLTRQQPCHGIVPPAALAQLDSVQSKTTVRTVRKQSLLSTGLIAIALCWNPDLLGQGVEIEKAPASATPVPTPTAAEELYAYLQKYHIEVAKDQEGSRLVWTDRVLIEIADAPPHEPLATLLASAPPNNGQFAKWVHDTFETQTKAWHPAKKNPRPDKAGTDEIVADSGGTRCYVNPVYIAYVLTRYPKAKILIKGPTDPALFTVNGQVRAIVSPWTKLPDGTPLL
jgi:hypothetical protein